MARAELFLKLAEEWLRLGLNFMGRVRDSRCDRPKL